MTDVTESTREARAFDPAIAMSWWSALTPDRASGRRGNPGALADLRRCATPESVQLLPVFETLVRELPRTRETDLAVVAAVLAHVREHEPMRVAQQIAAVSTGSLPPVSPERFRRLLQVQGPEERLKAGVRLVRILRGRVNVADLALALYDWDRNPQIVRSWARTYYSNLPNELLKKS